MAKGGTDGERSVALDFFIAIDCKKAASETEVEAGKQAIPSSIGHCTKTTQEGEGEGTQRNSSDKLRCGSQVSLLVLNPSKIYSIILFFMLCLNLTRPCNTPVFQFYHQITRKKDSFQNGGS